MSATPAVTGFADHFSGHAQAYRRYRPSYPAPLFAWLAKTTPGTGLAWDCATGSGQAALALARHFDKVIASDASAAQIDKAMQSPTVEYRVAHAEDSGLETDSVDLVAIAQSLHWFDNEPFYEEVRRVLRPGGLVAAWSYGLMDAGPQVNGVIRHLYTDILGPLWPPERRHVDAGYKTLTFPFEPVEPPAFEMSAYWGLAHLTGYLETWSAVIKYKAAEGRDPVLLVQDDLADAWGDPGRARLIRWPLYLLAGRVTA